MSDDYKPATISGKEARFVLPMKDLKTICRDGGWKIIDGQGTGSGFLRDDYLDFIALGAGPMGTLIHYRKAAGNVKKLNFLHRPNDAVVAFDAEGNEYYFYLYLDDATVKLKFEFYFAEGNGPDLETNQDDHGNGDPGYPPR